MAMIQIKRKLFSNVGKVKVRGSDEQIESELNILLLTFLRTPGKAKILVKVINNLNVTLKIAGGNDETDNN